MKKNSLFRTLVVVMLLLTILISAACIFTLGSQDLQADPATVSTETPFIPEIFKTQGYGPCEPWIIKQWGSF